MKSTKEKPAASATPPTRPTPPTPPTRPTPARSRRSISSLLYGPGAVSLRAARPNIQPEAIEEANMVKQPIEVEETVVIPVDTSTSEPEEVLEITAVEVPGVEPESAPSENAADPRANRIVSSLLAKEKADLPEWMEELLAPMDEPDQLAFLLKHRAEIKASRRGRVGVPASPAVDGTPSSPERASAVHRGVYDGF